MGPRGFRRRRTRPGRFRSRAGPNRRSTNRRAGRAPESGSISASACPMRRRSGGASRARSSRARGSHVRGGSAGRAVSMSSRPSGSDKAPLGRTRSWKSRPWRPRRGAASRCGTRERTSQGSPLPSGPFRAARTRLFRLIRHCNEASLPPSSYGRARRGACRAFGAQREAERSQLRGSQQTRGDGACRHVRSRHRSPRGRGCRRDPGRSRGGASSRSGQRVRPPAVCQRPTLRVRAFPRPKRVRA